MNDSDSPVALTAEGSKPTAGIPRHKRIAIIVLLLYVVLFPVMLLCSYHFLKNTAFVFEAAKGSIVDRAMTMSKQYLASQVAVNPLFVYAIQDFGASTVLTDEFKNFSLEFEAMAKENWSADVRTIEGYYLVLNFSLVRKRFVGGPHDSSTIIVLDIIPDMTVFLPKFEDFWASWRSSHPPSNSTFRIKTTSIREIQSDITTGVLGDIVRIDSIVVPIAFAVLAYCLGSVRMLLVPLTVIPCTVLLTFSVMLPLSYLMQIFAMAPEIVAGTILGLSIDYCLFIVSRFHDQVVARETELGESPETEWIVVKSTTVLSASNILVSGITIAVALGALVCIPVSIFQTLGVSFFVGCLSTVFVSLTLIPAILLTFYKFFRQPPECEKCCAKKCKGEPEEEQEGSVEKDVEYHVQRGKERESTGLLDSGHVSAAVARYHAEQRRLQYRSFWFRLGRTAWHHPVLVSVITCLLGVPFFILAGNLRLSFDLFQEVPRGSPHVQTLQDIVNTVGQSTPYYVTFFTDHEGGIMDDRVFTLVNNLTFRLSSTADQPLDHILSFACIFGIPINLAKAEEWYENNILGYQYFFNHSVDSTRQAAVIAMVPTFDPFNAQALDYLDKVNDVIEDFDTEGKFWVGLTGASSMTWSIVRKVTSLYPLLITITFAFMFTLTGLAFRSFVIPLRMLLTIAYTVGITTGFGVILFEHEWAHSWWPQMRGVSTFTWTVPFFSFFLLCALALDYDVFLLTRIFEYKKQGFNDEAAITKAVWKTGRIISYAGLIMAISFTSLILSNTGTLNQLGTVAAFAVLLDTFVIRPLFVPALMAIYPKLSWWPRVYSDHLTVNDMNEASAEDKNPGNADGVAA